MLRVLLEIMDSNHLDNPVLVLRDKLVRHKPAILYLRILVELEMLVILDLSQVL